MIYRFNIFFCLLFILLNNAYAEDVGTQYLFIIDDSGSMGLDYGTNIPADRNRLAIFAAKSMLLMLTDDDEVGIIRLNGERDQDGGGKHKKLPADSAIQIEPLRVQKKNINEILSLKNTLAAYAGSNTPCSSALGRARDVLNNSYKSGVKQVVFFLTDGACEIGESKDNVPPSTSWLQNVSSAKAEQLRFFLLTFEGRDFSEELINYTKDSEGGSIGHHVQVNADDPSGIVRPFAEALAYAKGVSPYILSEDTNIIPKHPAAYGVRLLAVSKDDDSNKMDITLSTSTKNGKDYPSKVLGTIQHQWVAKDNEFTYTRLINDNDVGRKFKATVNNYTPDDNEIKVEASNIQKNWKVIAIPNYQLSMKTEIRQGNCDSLGEKYEVGHAPKKGETACVLVSIYNHSNNNITQDIVDSYPDTFVEMRLIVNDEKSKKVRFQRIGKNKYFASTVKFDQVGNYKLTPYVQLIENGLQLTGETYTFSSYEVQIIPTPSEIDFGHLGLGDATFKNVQLLGRFNDGRAVVVVNTDEHTSCLHITVGDQETGSQIDVSQGMELRLDVNAADLCGSTSLDKFFTGTISLNFPNDGYFNKQVITIPWKVHVSSTVGTPKDLEITLRAGESYDINMEEIADRIWKNAPKSMEVMVAGVTSDWPKELQFSSYNVAKDEKILTLEGKEQTIQKFTFIPRNTEKGVSPTSYRITSDICCAGDNYNAQIFLRPNGDEKAQLIQNVSVKIVPRTWLECYFNTLMWILKIILVLLLLAYIYNIYQKSHFISGKNLAERFIPLEYKAANSSNPSDMSDYNNLTLKINDELIRSTGVAGFKFSRLKYHQRRFWNWVKANPLRIGLPGKEPYYETMRIIFGEESISFNLIPKAGMRTFLQKDESVDGAKFSEGGFFLSAPRNFVFRYKSNEIPEAGPHSLKSKWNSQQRQRDRKQNNAENMWITTSAESQKIYNYTTKSRKRREFAGWRFE